LIESVLGKLDVITLDTVRATMRSCIEIYQTNKKNPIRIILRRGRDSNPRYPNGYNGFRDRPIQPLSHLSNIIPVKYIDNLAKFQHGCHIWSLIRRGREISSIVGTMHSGNYVITHNSNGYYSCMATNTRYRHSRQREIILTIVQNSQAHPTAEWIYEKAREEIPRISLGTVYRNLKLLSNRNLIREIQIGDSQTRYDSHHQDHGHFICTHCGTIFDLMTVDSSHQRMSIERKIRCYIHSYRLDYFGICHRCRKDGRKSQKLVHHERKGKKAAYGRP
jgi:Fur family transcriptional regulator, peroxide stress response regulator